MRSTPLGRRDEAVVLLHKALADNGGADVMEEAVKRLAAWEGLEKAGESVVEMLARRPSLSAFSTMMTLRQKERPDDEETKLLATLLQRHGRRFTKYQCSNCGFLCLVLLLALPRLRRLGQLPAAPHRGRQVVLVRARGMHPARESVIKAFLQVILRPLLQLS